MSSKITNKENTVAQNEQQCNNCKYSGTTLAEVIVSEFPKILKQKIIHHS